VSEAVGLVREGAARADHEPAAAPRESRASRRLIIAAALSLTFVAYVGTLGYQFVYDDRGQIVDNRLIRSWHHVPRYFAGHSWNHLYPHLLGNYYRPTFLIWSLVNHMLFGLNAFWWHLAAVGLHVSATLLVYLLARRLLKDQFSAGVAAVVFGLHPVHIEAVAWVSGATESLLAVLLIPAFLCYLNWRESRAAAAGAKTAGAGDSAGKSSRRWKWVAASLVLYWAAMFAKETALVLPILVCAYEWIYGSDGAGISGRFGRARAALMVAAPYVALTCVYLFIRAVALSGLSHTVTPLPKSTILLTWPSLIWFYVKLLLWPVGLSAFYDTPYVSQPGLANFYLPCVAVIMIATALWAWSRRSKEVAFASVLLLLPMLPLLNLSVFIQGEIAHDRYLYLPSIGFSVIAAQALRRIDFGPAKLFGRPAPQVASILALTALLGLGTATQSLHWANGLLLYYRGVTVAPDNDIAKNNLANEMVEREMYQEAINLYMQVIDRNPAYWLAHYNLGFAYYKLGALEEAEKHFTIALQINKLDPDEFARLSLTQMRLGRLDDAEATMRRAIEIRPDAPGYHYALGVILRKKGNLQDALNEFKTELTNDPDQAAARDQILEIEAGR
jgi:tetratricopeptide (TPR) repeat protein